MNITVTQTSPQSVEVRTPVQVVETNSPIIEAVAVAKTVEVALSGFFIERNINGDPDAWTIWFEEEV